MKYLLCFGNPYIKEDNLIIDISAKLKIPGYEIKKCSSPEEILSYLDKDFIILDVAKGIDELSIITDADQLNSTKLVTLHDFDLNFFLKLHKKIGNKIKILAVPCDYDADKLIMNIKKLIKSI